MKKFFIILSTLIYIFLLCSCNKVTDNLSTMEKIQKQLNEMTSYSCTATLKRISNKGENTYEIKQYYKSSGEYRLEMISPETVSGNFTVFDGKSIGQFNPRVSGKIIKNVAENKQRNELFLGNFVKNYMQSENVSILTANMDLGKCTVLEAVIPGNNKYTATEKLWIDEETLLPVQFVIYDVDGKERYIINYKDFEFNIELDENLFKIE